MDGKKKVAFVGGGQMASALIGSMMSSSWASEQVSILEPDEQRRIWLHEQFGVQTLDRPDASLNDVAIVVWAVKPQTLRSAMQAVGSTFRDALHVSICAGVSLATLSRWLETDRLVRVMPNTPALVGAGVSAIHASPAVSNTDRELVERIFAGTGYTFWAKSDDQIDKATAVSGSGPGYVFEFLRCFQDAAQQLGFSKDEARNLILKTTAGAVRQAEISQDDLTVLRDRVTSRGGTTEAGLEVLRDRFLHDAMGLAISAAYGRAKALSRELDS